MEIIDHPSTDRPTPLYTHLAELRLRLMYSIAFFLVAFLGCYFFASDIYGFLVRPLAALYEGQEERKLIYTGLTEAFLTYVSMAFFAALFVSFPFIAAQAYLFLAPGLYKHEKKVLLPFLIVSPILFVMGAALVYYWIFPMAWSFFLSFEQPGEAGALPIRLEARVSEYLSLVMQLMLAFGLAFQLPVVLNLLARIGIVNSRGLAAKRKYAIVIIFIIAAVITPPDVISQIGLALPMCLLYECSVLSCRWIEKEKRKKEEDAQSEIHS